MLPVLVAIGMIGFGVASCIEDTEPPSSAPNELSDGGPDTDGSPSEADAEPSDAGNEGDTGPSDASHCDLAAPFDGVELLQINTPEDESSATLSADELQLVFSTTGREPLADGGTVNDNAELWVATRNAVTEPFTTSSNSWTKEINTLGALDAYPTLSVDARELIWITRPRIKVGPPPQHVHQIRSATRLDTKGPFESSTEVKFTSGVLADSAYPSLTFALPNGALYFSMAEPPGSPSRTFRAERAGAATYGEPVAEKFTDTDIEGGRPLVPTNDELAAYVVRSEDIYLVRRATVTEPWGAGVVVSEINSPNMEYPLWLSPDHCRLYFSSNRPGGVGKRDLYVATRRR